jgi:cellulose synthase operon protein YhjQ
MTLATSHHHGQSSTVGEIAPHADGMDRILIDISTASFTLLREILPLSPTVLVVLAPDMASVVSLLPVQRALQQMEDETDTEIETFFVLNQFDPTLRLHRDIRDRLTRQLGKLLLPIAIHRSNAVSEALAGGMTILDYAPDAPAVEDLRDLAQWVRELPTSAADDADHVLWGGQRC